MSTCVAAMDRLALKLLRLILGNEHGIIGKRDILVRKRGQANSSGNEVLDKVSISHRLYNPLS